MTGASRKSRRLGGVLGRPELSVREVMERLTPARAALVGK